MDYSSLLGLKTIAFLFYPYLSLLQNLVISLPKECDFYQINTAQKQHKTLLKRITGAYNREVCHHREDPV
jgi:hypothetical protein